MDTGLIQRMMEPEGRLLERLLPGGKLDEKAWDIRTGCDFGNGMFSIPEADLEFYLQRRESKWCCKAYRRKGPYMDLLGEAYGGRMDTAVRNMARKSWKEIGWIPEK